MAQNDIALMGAVYPDVPAVTLHIDGGGTAKFTDVSDTTASASDVAQGKYFYNSSGVYTEGTASGGGSTLITKSITQNGTYNASSDNADGYSSVTVNVSGGASNVVTGTFKGTTTGAAMDVTIPYTGTGYPIAAIIAPTGGVNGNSSFNSLVARYSVGMYTMYKCYTETMPTYGTSGTANEAFVAVVYKNSASSSISYARSGSYSANTLSSSAATGSAATVLRFNSNKKMSVFVHNAGTNYGFAANIEYTYHVIYSS